MSADKRSVSTDALETLGSIITPNEKRDAIHLAVIPVQATMDLAPSASIDVGDGDQAYMVPMGEGLGIVDPFIPGFVRKGQWFWLVIYPRQITSLRHVWTHPAFDNTEVEEALPEVSEYNRQRAELLINPHALNDITYVTSLAHSLSTNYDELMINAAEYLRSGDYWSEGEKFEGEHIPEEFWDSYEKLTGEMVDGSDRGNFLSCSC